LWARRICRLLAGSLTWMSLLLSSNSACVRLIVVGLAALTLFRLLALRGLAFRATCRHAGSGTTPEPAQIGR